MPLARSLGNVKGSKMVPVGSNGPQITHLIIPEGPGSPLKKHIFVDILLEEGQGLFRTHLGPILPACAAPGLFPDCAVGAMGEPRPDKGIQRSVSTILRGGNHKK